SLAAETRIVRSSRDQPRKHKVQLGADDGAIRLTTVHSDECSERVVVNQLSVVGGVLLQHVEWEFRLGWNSNLRGLYEKLWKAAGAQCDLRGRGMYDVLPRSRSH